jgi:tetratricopeptide (TPR) repeat protein
VAKKWTEDEENNSEAWYEYGFANEKLLKLDIALSSYNKSISIDKNNSDSLFRSALIYHKNGNLSKAKTIQKDLFLINEAKGLELEELL